MSIPFVLSAVSLGLVVFSFFFFRWYIARKTDARELLADYQAAVDSLVAKIDAAADRDSLLVEERIKTLKKTIEETDRRIGVYMRELQRSRSGEALYNSLGRGIRAALDSRAPQLELPMETPPQASPSAQAQEPPQEQQDHELAKATDAPTADASAASKKRGAKKPKIKMQIAEMAALGIPTEKIASRLKISIAEVELALNLLHRNS